jgi:hypothetical protein
MNTVRLYLGIVVTAFLFACGSDDKVTMKNLHFGSDEPIAGVEARLKVISALESSLVSSIVSVGSTSFGDGTLVYQRRESNGDLSILAYSKSAIQTKSVVLLRGSSAENQFAIVDFRCSDQSGNRVPCIAEWR